MTDYILNAEYYATTWPLLWWANAPLIGRSELTLYPRGVALALSERSPDLDLRSRSGSWTVDTDIDR
jgi:hypothetical protein